MSDKCIYPPAKPYRKHEAIDMKLITHFNLVKHNIEVLPYHEFKIYTYTKGSALRSCLSVKCVDKVNRDMNKTKMMKLRDCDEIVWEFMEELSKCKKNDLE